jgi:hypothetical protein
MFDVEEETIEFERFDKMFDDVDEGEDYEHTYMNTTLGGEALTVMRLTEPQSDDDDDNDSDSEDVSYDSVVRYATWAKGTAISRAELKVEESEDEGDSEEIGDENEDLYALVGFAFVDNDNEIENKYE